MFTLDRSYDNNNELSDEINRLYARFVAGHSMSDVDMIKILSNKFNFDLTVGESPTIAVFDKRMTFIECQVDEKEQLTHIIYVDEVTGAYYRQTKRMEFFTSIQIHDKWEKVLQRKVVMNVYDVDCMHN